MSDKKEVVIKDDILKLSAEAAKDIKIDAKTGIATISDDFYERHLPVGLTVAQRKEYQEFEGTLLHAIGHALGEQSIPVMKKHKDLTATTLEVGTVGRDKFEFKFNRETKAPAGPAGGDPVTKFGTLDVKARTYAANGQRGDLKKVKEDLSMKAMAAFGK